MGPEGRLLQQIQLDNGLTIYLHDESKRVAGNRWQLRLSIIVPMIVKAEYFTTCADPRQAFQEFTTACGNTVQFTLEKVRNFVDENEADVVMEQMIQEFLQSNQAYISSTRFPERFVTKKYAQWKEEESCRKSHLEAIKKAELKG